MPLVEVVQRARHACGRRARTPSTFARQLDKLPVPCRSAPGFIVNRVLMPYLHEAMFAAQEGVPLPVIDAAAVDFGMPMGPVELADVVGLDVAKHVGEIIAAELGRAPPELTQLKALHRREEARPQERRGLLRMEGRQGGEAAGPHPASRRPISSIA